MSYQKYNVRRMTSKYLFPNSSSSIAEILITLALFFASIVAIYFSMLFAMWSLPIWMILTSFFFVRIFILHHDLAHGNLFKKKSINHFIGVLLSIIVFTPYFLWRKAHIVHHNSGGNADKRPWVGDISTITVQEYLSKGKLERLCYRLYRNSFIMFILGPFYVFLIEQRFYKKLYRNHRAFSTREHHNVIGTNIAIVALYGSILMVLGIKFVILAIFIPFWLAGIIGIHLFYIQHNFRTKYFVNQKEWNFKDSALKGSSFYDLPAPLRWLTGNIGYHHVHTLLPRIPFYWLKKCHEEYNFLHEAPRIYLKDVPSLFLLKLYDEDSAQMITWKEYRIKYSKK